MEEEVKKYKMTENVSTVIELFLFKSNPKIEETIREKDLKAAATLMEEPIFVSKGKNTGVNFEKNTLLDFNTIRDKYLELLHEAIGSFEKENMFTDDGFNSPIKYDNRLQGFGEYIDYNYNAFYPFSKQCVKEIIENKCEHVLESYHRDFYDEDNDCWSLYVYVDEETIWLAKVYTKQLVDILKQKMDGHYIFDEESGLSHDNVDGIGIDNEKNVITFYTWDIPIDDEDGSEYNKWELCCS